MWDLVSIILYTPPKLSTKHSILPNGMQILCIFINLHYCYFFSECLDGVVTCFQDFVPDMDNRLNTSQLSQLSDLLKKFFVFENNRKDSILSDIRKIITIGDSKS